MTTFGDDICHMIMAPLMQIIFQHERTRQALKIRYFYIIGTHHNILIQVKKQTNEHIQLLSSNTVISGLLRQHITTLHLQEIINVEG